MRFFAQVFAVTALTLRTLPQRAGSSIVAVIGVTGVVIVFVAVLSIAEGFRAALTGAGSPDTAIVMRGGSDSELSSGITLATTRIVKDAPGVRRGDGGPVASAELFVVVDVPKRSTGSPANVPLRGVEPAVADRDDPRRMNVLVRPVHLGDMYQPFNPFFDLGEAAVVSEVRHDSLHAGAGRIPSGEVDPRVVPELLHPERYAVFLAVEPKDLDLHLVADIDHLAWMPDAPPGHVGNVQQAVDTTEVDERAVVCEVLDDPGHALAFLQRSQELFALGAVLVFEYGATGDDHVVASLIQLDDLELERLALEMRGLAQGANVYQRTGQERTDIVDVDGETALDPAVQQALDRLSVLERILEHFPAFRPPGLLAGKARRAPSIVHDFHRDLDLVANLDLELAALGDELAAWNDAFRLQSRMNHHHFAVDVYHRTGHDGAGLHLDGVHALFE